MSLHYQVNTVYSLTHGKPSLISLSINSTHSAVTELFVFSGLNLLKNYRIFHSLNDANNYIKYLKRIYKNCKLPQPVLDSGQKYLF